MRFKESKIHSVLGYMAPRGRRASLEMSITSDPISSIAVMQAKGPRLHSIARLIIV